jgi:hypothetical protein
MGFRTTLDRLDRAFIGRSTFRETYTTPNLDRTFDELERSVRQAFGSEFELEIQKIHGSYFLHGYAGQVSGFMFGLVTQKDAIRGDRILTGVARSSRWDHSAGLTAGILSFFVSIAAVLLVQFLGVLVPGIAWAGIAIAAFLISLFLIYQVLFLPLIAACEYCAGGRLSQQRMDELAGHLKRAFEVTGGEVVGNKREPGT